MKGATGRGIGLINKLKAYFNPRTREGCDNESPVIKPGYTHFNPRTREGCDQESLVIAGQHTADFNPRTREGCDIDFIREKKLA